MESAKSFLSNQNSALFLLIHSSTTFTIFNKRITAQEKKSTIVLKVTVMEAELGILTGTPARIKSSVG